MTPQEKYNLWIQAEQLAMQHNNNENQNQYMNGRAPSWWTVEDCMRMLTEK